MAKLRPCPSLSTRPSTMLLYLAVPLAGIDSAILSLPSLSTKDKTSTINISMVIGKNEFWTMPVDNFVRPLDASWVEIPSPKTTISPKAQLLGCLWTVWGFGRHH